MKAKVKQFKQTLSQEFHTKTKIEKIKDIPVKDWPKEWIKVYFKGYPRFPALSLPTPSLGKNISLKETLFNRNSFRDFSEKSMKQQTLSNLLYYSAGIREKNETWTGNRFYASAGGRYALEVYPIILNVQGVNDGIYHYYLKNHLLEVLPKKPDFKKRAIDYFSNPWAEKANVLLIISAVFYRTKVKYGERGYRHVLTELGLLMQNIYLLCSALGVGCCPTGGYIDDDYNALLDLDGVEESVIGVVAIGEK